MRMYHFDTSALIHARRRAYPIQNFHPKLILLLSGKPGAVQFLLAAAFFFASFL